jgi:hypothetical protein
LAVCRLHLQTAGGGRYFDPLLGIWLALTPLLVVQSWRGRKRKRGGAWHLLLALLVVGVGGTLTGCGGVPGGDTPQAEACVTPPTFEWPTDTPQFGPQPLTPVPTSTPSPLPEIDANDSSKRQDELGEIQKALTIRLPPAYKFQYAETLHGVDAGECGWTPWFDETNWRNVYVFEKAFTFFSYNPWDIAGVMIHEATHAWIQVSLEQMAKDFDLPETERIAYRQSSWNAKYNPLFEVQADNMALGANASGRIHMSDSFRKIMEDHRNVMERQSRNLCIPGVETVHLIGRP